LKIARDDGRDPERVLGVEREMPHVLHHRHVRPQTWRRAGARGFPRAGASPFSGREFA
jgi:hypothetical protein